MIGTGNDVPDDQTAPPEGLDSLEEYISPQAAAAGPDPEVTQMLALAAKHGYTCQPHAELLKELGRSIASRMTPRRGAAIYQMMAFSMHAFPLQALEKIFSGQHLTAESAAAMEWKLPTVLSLSQVLGPVLSRSGYVCAGATRAWRTPSQPVIRQVATLLPEAEMTLVKMPGASRWQLYVNMMYAIVTEHGEIAWPKDNARREIQFSAAEEKEVRQQVLADMLALGGRGEPLSPAWWRQLGEEEKAREVELQLNPPRPPRKQKQLSGAAASTGRKAPAVKRTRFTKETYEIDRILAEKTVSTKERVVYLVRWAGYDPSWEPARVSGAPGGALKTWEPLLLLQGTVALREWRAIPPALN